MIIREMSATFGRLDGAAMALESGLNLISAPNESGKSTWCAFMRAMLYGVPSTERARTGYLPDKTKYAPWSGAPMQGEMRIESRGREITLRRGTKNPAMPMREFSAVYTGTNTKVVGLNGTNAGDELLGVSREVFRRSAFIGQGDVAVTGSAELEKRIVAVVTSGEEGTSYTEADDRLRAWQRKRRWNKRGAIPELENEMAGDRARLARLESSVRERADAEKELERACAESARLRHGLAGSRADDSTALLQRLDAVRQRASECEQLRFGAAGETERRETAFGNGVFGGKSPDEAAILAADDAEEAEQLGEAASTARSPLPTAIFAVLCLAAAAAGAFLSTYGYIAAAVLAVLTVIFAARYSKGKKQAAYCASSRAEILRRYGVADESGIYAAADAHAEDLRALESAREAENAAVDALASARSEVSEVELHIVSGGEDSARTLRLLRELESAREREDRLKARTAELSGAASAVGDPLAIGSALLEREERLGVLTEQYAAIELACATLREADEEMQSRFSPELARKAAEYMGRMTDGRYAELFISRDFSAMAKLAGDVSAREAAYMSAGAYELMYLAVRLAVCELALPQDDPCPIVLDDALVNLDDVRREKAMELLREISRERQVIIFSCR